VVGGAQAHYDGAGNQLPQLNDSHLAATLLSTASPSRDRVTENGSGPTTSHATDYDVVDWTLTTISDVNVSHVAKLYRSWDDSFLPEVITTSLLSRRLVAHN